MEKSSKNLMLCGMIFAIALVVSNIVASKTVMTGFMLFGSPVIVPSAVICYCITFLITDVVGEIWGRKEAQQIVKWGFVCQVIACCLILCAQFLPAASDEMQGAYTMLLGQNFVFVIASLTAYLASQSWDVYVFHKIRSVFMAKGKSSAWRWVWNNVSTMSSQAIDTVIYITIAFGIGMGWIFESSMFPVLAGMMIGQYVCKFILAAIDTPFFYFFTRTKLANSDVETEEQMPA